MNSTWFYGIPFAFNQFNILIPFPSPPLLLQLRQLKNPPNSLLHVQITLRLAEKKAKHTHTHREKKPCQFSIPIGQTHTRGRGERERGGKGESRQTTTIVGPFLFLLANIHSNCGYSHTLAHTLSTCHKLAKKEHRGATAKWVRSLVCLVSISCCCCFWFALKCTC